MKHDNNVLHYKRGLTFIKRMKEYLSSDKYSEESVCEFYNLYENRVKNHVDFSLFDLNNFLTLCTVVLMGLNKESIEKNNNLKEYKYKINYVCDTAMECIELMRKQVISSNNTMESKYRVLCEMDFIKNITYIFDNKRVVTTPYDKWLSVTQYNSVDNFTPNFLFMVRNALMHSEYDLELIDENKNFLFMNVQNSNYTNFLGKILNCNFMEFIKFFYSNDAYFGLVDKYFIGKCEYDDFKINNENEIDKLTDIEILQIKYSNQKREKTKTFEYINYGKRTIYHLPKYNVIDESIVINQEKKEQIKLLIEKYYGTGFYDLSGVEQGNIIFMIEKYLVSPSSYISEWIMHFYLNVVHTIHQDTYVDNIFTGIFALDAVFVILKSYLILYRLQNKAFEEVDYNLIGDFEYQYTEISDYDMYEKFRDKLQDKGIICAEPTYRKRYFCEVFRNALAHGNLEIEIEKNDKNEIIQKIILKDIYKGKERQLNISIEDLNIYLDSKAFSRKNAKNTI